MQHPVLPQHLAAALAGREVLLEAGASPNRRSRRREETVLHMLARRADATALLDAVLSRRVRVDRRDRFGWTPLMVAAREGSADVVARLLEAGGDLRVRLRSSRRTRRCRRQT